jgi:hypothetical protein
MQETTSVQRHPPGDRDFFTALVTKILTTFKGLARLGFARAAAGATLQNLVNGGFLAVEEGSSMPEYFAWPEKSAVQDASRVRCVIEAAYGD